MKLMIINSVCGTGSTGRIVTGVALKWLEQGHDVLVAYGIGEAKGIDLKHTYKISNKFLYYANNILSKATDLTGLFSKIATKKLIKKIKEYHPDIIHIHQLHGYYINFKMLFKFLSKTNIKIVYSIHDCWPFTGHCSHYNYIGCYKWKTKCHHCPQLKEYPKSYLFDNSRYMYETKKRYFNLSNLTITTPSTWLANEVKMSLLSKHDVFVVSPGIDENIFKIKESEFKKKFKNKKIVLCVANVWDLKKGLFDLYKLASLLEKQEDYLLVCVGGIKGKKEIRPNIYYVDQTNDIHELVDIYNSADVFVNLSYEETFGMVTLEALMCGTPVIVYNKTACPELVNSSCGKVVEAGNIELLFNTILTLPKFDKDQIRSNALKYTLNNMVNNYISLYK